MAGLKFRVLLDTDNNTEIFRDILINDTDNFEVFYKAIIQALISKEIKWRVFMFLMIIGTKAMN